MKTPILDSYFGPRQHSVAEDEPRLSRDELIVRMLHGGTRWHCEEPIKPALDSFIAAMGEQYMPKSAEARRSLYASARPLVQEIGEIEIGEFIRWAATYHNNHSLTVKDLRSFMHLVPKWRKRKSERMKACPSCFQVGTHAEDCEEESDVRLG